MRRFVGLAVLLFFTIPFGMSVAGCSKAVPVVYCNGGDSGPAVGQVATITLSPTLATYGESLSYGQIGEGLNATAQDCKGGTVSVRSYTYASSDTSMTYADINPASGQVCAGTWNRNTGGGVPNYTTCMPPTTTPSNYLAYVTASAAGAVSNAVPVFVHPVVTSVVIGNGTLQANCTAALLPGGNPSSNCCPYQPTAPGNPTLYDGVSCLSQGQTALLAARVFDSGGTSPANNITCQVGHLGFAASTSSNVVSIDENGVATAAQPGSSTITTTISNTGSASSAGFFSTCPPVSISLSATGQPAGATNINVLLNNAQTFSTTVLDKNGVPLTGLNLEFNSTTQQTIPTSGASVTPAFPGTATITAVCQPGICNPAPYNQIDLNDNGTPITSNGITVTTTGTSSTVLYVGSTNSQYIYPVDFTTNQPGTLVKLPYTPNSMVITQDGTTIYLGSSTALMTVNTASNAVISTNTNVTGPVLAVSPNGQTLVVTDPVRQTVSLLSGAGGVEATYGGVGTHAQWSPDSNTVYVTTQSNQLLVHSNFTGWTADTAGETYSDVALTVPYVGAYLAGPSFTDGRTVCPSSTTTNTTPPTVTNLFYPLADEDTAVTDRIAATTDGKHILGAHASATAAAILDDIRVTLPTTSVGGVTTIAACPAAPAVIAPGYFKSTAIPITMTGVSATAITGVLPATNSALAFITYTGTSSNAAGQLPYYNPSTGALNFVPLLNTTAPPVAGVFSSDNLTFYVGTGSSDNLAADNNVHVVTITYPSPTAPTPTDTRVLTPNLPGSNGGIVAPNLLVQRPKKSTTS